MINNGTNSTVPSKNYEIYFDPYKHAQVANYLSKQFIQWESNPPSSPWVGGS